MFGQFTTNIGYEDQSHPLSLVVAGKEGPSLLGRDWLSTLRLNRNSILSIEDDLNLLLKKHSEVFNGDLGLLKDFKAKLFIEPNVKPIFCNSHPIPYSIRSSVEKELDKLVSQQIIQPVPYSDLAAPIVPILKPDKKLKIYLLNYLVVLHLQNLI